MPCCLEFSGVGVRQWSHDIRIAVEAIQCKHMRYIADSAVMSTGHARCGDKTSGVNGKQSRPCGARAEPSESDHNHAHENPSMQCEYSSHIHRPLVPGAIMNRTGCFATTTDGMSV